MRKLTSLLRNFNRELGGFFIIGLMLRLVLMPYLIWPYDIGAYQTALTYLMNGYDPYALHASIYPPFVHFTTFPLFSLAYRFGFSFGSPSIAEFLVEANTEQYLASCQVNPIFLFLWKLPILFFDLLAGLLVYYFARELASDSETPKRCFLIWLFNPFTLAVSYLNGSYDVVVAFFILLGAYLLYKGNPVSAGICFGLGTLAKTAPVYIAVSLAIVVLFKRLPHAPHPTSFKNRVLPFVKFALGSALPFLLFAPLFIEYSYLMYSGISKEIAIMGGLNQWFLAADPDRAHLINRSIGLIQTTFSYYPAICIGIGLLFCVLSKSKQEEMLLATALFTNLTYLFLPITLQPQYLLWVLPLLVVLYSRRKRFLWSLGFYSVAGFFFYLSLQGPQAFLYPLATYTSLLSPQDLVGAINAYMNLPGFASRFFRQDLCTIWGGIGFLGQLLTLILLIMSSRDVC